MGKLHKLKRNEGEITVQVLREGKIIGGKYVAPGNVEVISGVSGETYWLTPDVARANYKPDADFLKELEEANQEVE